LGTSKILAIDLKYLTGGSRDYRLDHYHERYHVYINFTLTTYYDVLFSFVYSDILAFDAHELQSLALFALLESVGQIKPCFVADRISQNTIHERLWTNRDPAGWVHT